MSTSTATKSPVHSATDSTAAAGSFRLEPNFRAVRDGYPDGGVVTGRRNTIYRIHQPGIQTASFPGELSNVHS
jgi:hypothetical protein